MILLDTHALLWWLSGSKELPKNAKKAIGDEFKKGEVYYSSISIWEATLLYNKGKIDLNMDISSWLRFVEQIEEIKSIPIDNKIAYLSVNLPGKFHKDPADRLITATAIVLGCPIATGDKKIQNYRGVKTIW